jgi:15-cis-phytoene synthase
MTGLHFRSHRARSGLEPVAGTIDAIDAGAADIRVFEPAGLADSYRWCCRCTRASRSNFYLSFLTLPKNVFRDLCALYAFMRVSDDLGDDATIPLDERAAALGRWRTQIAQALCGGAFEHPALPALADMVHRHAIPHRYLFDVLDGVESDLDSRGFETFEELADYCYHVAGAVGLCCLSIWGYTDERAKSLAVDCGLAFQLTNILRDVAEDARIGRCYLPRDDLKRFGLTIDCLRTGAPSVAFRDLMAWETARARTYFARAEELVPLCSPVGRPILDAMRRTYAALLNAIEASNYAVHGPRIRIGRWRKAAIALSSLWRYRGRVEPRTK